MLLFSPFNAIKHQAWVQILRVLSLFSDLKGTNHADLSNYCHWDQTRGRSHQDCLIMQRTPKMPSPYLHPCAMLSKCSRSYTIQRIKAFPSLSTCAFVWLFVSTHDRPPGLGREVMLMLTFTFTYLYVSRYHVPNPHTVFLHLSRTFL